MGKILGIDIGGTFTDGVLIDEKGGIKIAKTPSTPKDQSIGVMDCWGKLDLKAADLDIFVHGSTVATNAIIERTATEKIAHITTNGMRDVLEFHRGDRDDIFNIQWIPPLPVVFRKDIYTVDERLMWDGSVRRPLNEEEARRVAQIIKEKGYEAVSITFLHSYQNDSHEKRMREIIREACPDIYISISSEILPQYREFERSSTTVCNAYLMPIIHRYLEGLETKAQRVGYRHGILIMQSSGGLITSTACREVPGKIVMSGPAGGAVAASYMAKVTGYKNIISLDMGGTSTDICLIRDGEARWTHEQQFTWGVPIRFPSLDLVTVGAGGGTIAWLGPGGVLRVGPKSAGADPGPACYDRGGTEPTTTDAQIVLRRLNPGNFLGGEMKIKPEASYEAIKKRIADPLGMGVEEAAKGILKVNIDNTMGAMRLTTIERGYDPRDFSLLIFGGSGGLYGTELANELLISQVIIPHSPGVLSAMGMIFADQRYDGSRSILMRQSEMNFGTIEENFQEIEKEVDGMLEAAGIPRERRSFQRYLDMRYVEQGFEITVPVDGGPFNEDCFNATAERFHREHEREYSYCDRSIELELVIARAFGIGQMPKPELRKFPLGSEDAGHACIDTRKVHFLDTDDPIPTTIYDRALLKAGNKFEGPAIVEQMDSTTIIQPGMSAQVDEFLNIIINTQVKPGEILWKWKRISDTAIYSSRRM